MSICTKCEKRNLCQGLCPEVELYANQDHVEWSEAPVKYADPETDELRVFDVTIGTDKPYLSKTEKAVLSRLGSGMTRKEISEDLSMSRDYVKKVCHRLKDKAGQLFP